MFEVAWETMRISPMNDSMVKKFSGVKISVEV
jgi:hypothetical protein